MKRQDPKGATREALFHMSHSMTCASFGVRDLDVIPAKAGHSRDGGGDLFLAGLWNPFKNISI